MRSASPTSPSTRCRPSHRWRHAAGITLTLAVLTAFPHAAADEPADAALVQAVGVLEQAFRASSATALRDIFPRQGKLFFSLPSLTSKSGYFSPDQCYYILSEVFERTPVLSFGTDGTGRSSGERRRVVRGQARVKTRDGNDRSLEIQFLLSREGEKWVLREIRENYRG